MAGKKAMPPPPIDRPLSKAYLRKFTGWSTATPPGMSDPTSLRVMHNCNVDTDGSLRIRPGLRRVFSNIADKLQQVYDKLKALKESGVPLEKIAAAAAALACA